MKMIKAYSTKQLAPLFKKHETLEHTYPAYPHLVKEKVWKLRDGSTFHRIYVMNLHGMHKEFVCDLITDETGICVHTQMHTVHVCDKRGHEYFMYNIRRKV